MNNGEEIQLSTELIIANSNTRGGLFIYSKIYMI